jgi:hypothetical protein
MFARMALILSIAVGCFLSTIKVSGGDNAEIFFPPIQTVANPDFNPNLGSEGDADEELENIQVPIEKKDRVPNKTGIQCVYSTLETLARFALEKKLFNLTERPECQGFSNPNVVNGLLKRIGVKFEQTTNRNDRRLLVKGCTLERRGVLFDIPGHAMTLVHYDEEKRIVKYINNSDRTLAIRTWSLDTFNQKWGGWVLILYAEDDIIPFKYFKVPFLKIVDRNNPQGSYDKDYIFRPKRF